MKKLLILGGTRDTSVRSDYNFKFNKIEATVNDLLAYYSSFKKWERAKNKKNLSRTLESTLIEKLKKGPQKNF